MWLLRVLSDASFVSLSQAPSKIKNPGGKPHTTHHIQSIHKLQNRTALPRLMFQSLTPAVSTLGGGYLALQLAPRRSSAAQKGTMSLIPRVTELRYTGSMKCDSSAPCKPRTFQRKILSLQDMVRNLSPCWIPSHVGTMSLDSTGMVPSPV